MNAAAGGAALAGAAASAGPAARLASFWQEVAGRARVEFECCGRRRHAPAATLLKFAAQFAFVFACIAGVYASGRDLPWAQLGAYALAAVPVLALTAGAGHDACHGAVFAGRLPNACTLVVVSILNGADARLVRLRHLGHHAAPAVAGADAEYAQVKILRLAHLPPLRPWHRWQHWYAWPLYALGVPFVAFVLDPAQCLRGPASSRVAHAAAMAATKLAHVGIWIVAPLGLGSSPWAVIAGYAVFACTVSFAFTAVLVGTHLVEGARTAPLGGLAGRAAWLDRQLRSAIDIAPRSRLARWFFGGIHTHAAHHLFPGLSHGRIEPFRRIVEATAARHGIALIQTSVAGVVAGHFRYLRRLGRPRDPGVADGARMARPAVEVEEARARCAASVREARAAVERLRGRAGPRAAAPHRHFYFALLLQVSLERLQSYAGRSSDPWLIYSVIAGAWRAYRRNVLECPESGDAAASPDWGHYRREVGGGTGAVTLFGLRRLLIAGIRAHHRADLPEALRDAIRHLPPPRRGDVRTAFLSADIVPALAAAVEDYFAAVHRWVALPVPASWRVPVLRAAYRVGDVPSIARIQQMRRAVFDATFGERFQ